MIEGATYWQISRYIIIPIIKPILKVCVIFSITGSLKVFDLIYVLTSGGHVCDVPSTLMVERIFLSNQYGFGSAIAIFIIAICFFFATLIQKLFKSEVD
jgi:raffinose/stachyose/melibiose transport system permease protein